MCGKEVSIRFGVGRWAFTYGFVGLMTESSGRPCRDVGPFLQAHIAYCRGSCFWQCWGLGVLLMTTFP